MPTRKEFLDEALKPRQDWQEFLSQQALGDLEKAEAQLESTSLQWTEMLDRLHYALDILRGTIRARKEEREADHRKKRRAKAAVSLREFLSGDQQEPDLALRDLPLCTKTGATVLLEGLTFKTQSGEVKVQTANEAKRLLKAGNTPKAYYDLHYVRDGRISAGFGWDRPFLDEVFLFPEKR